MTKNTFRLMSLLPALFCAGLLSYAYYVEYRDFLLPCNLCILQRVVFFTIGVLFLLALIKPAVHWGRKVFGGLLTLTTATGIAISGRHVWMQGLPPEEVPDCGPSLGMMMENDSIFGALSTVLTGSGSCAEIKWELFGLSMPTWTLFCFVGLFIYTLIWTFIKVES